MRYADADAMGVFEEGKATALLGLYGAAPKSRRETKSVVQGGCRQCPEDEVQSRKCAGVDYGCCVLKVCRRLQLGWFEQGKSLYSHGTKVKWTPWEGR
jgi:hypothetical protein